MKTNAIDWLQAASGKAFREGDEMVAVRVDVVADLVRIAEHAARSIGALPREDTFSESLERAAALRAVYRLTKEYEIEDEDWPVPFVVADDPMKHGGEIGRYDGAAEE